MLHFQEIGVIVFPFSTSSAMPPESPVDNLKVYDLHRSPRGLFMYLKDRCYAAFASVVLSVTNFAPPGPCPTT